MSSSKGAGISPLAGLERLRMASRAENAIESMV